MKEVIDTRFLAEYFNTTNTVTKKKTRRKLASLISKNEGVLPTIVIAEITQITCSRRGKDMARSHYQALVQSGLEIQSLTPAIAEQAGLCKCQYNLPMGDCIIAATAMVTGGRVLSDDLHFDCLTGTKRVWI